MNMRPMQNQDIQGWVKALAPWVMMGMTIWYFMGGADATQATSTKQLDRIEVNVTELTKTVNDLRVSVGKLEMKIIAMENPLRRQEQAQLSGK